MFQLHSFLLFNYTFLSMNTATNRSIWNATTPNPNNDYVVPYPPTASISCIRFNSSSNLLAVTSWNNQAIIYKYNDKLLKCTQITQTNHD